MVLLALLAAAAPAAAVDSVRVMGLFKDKAVVQIDGTQRVLEAGQTSPEGVKLISADAHQAVLEIDGKRAAYGLGGHISSTYAARRDKPVTVRIWPDSSGTYTVAGSINGFPVDFLVDTGATQIAMNRKQARRLGIDFRVSGEPGFASTASGTVRSYNVVLDRVRVGEIELHNVRAAVIDGDHPVYVLLGMSFLGRVDTSREGRLLELRKKPY